MVLFVVFSRDADRFTRHFSFDVLQAFGGSIDGVRVFRDVGRIAVAQGAERGNRWQLLLFGRGRGHGKDATPPVTSAK